jgi:CRISPR-associated protein Csm4
MQTYAVYLYPKSTFFSSLPTSDTLFGAICWAVYHLWGENELKTMLEEFVNKKPRFILSSSFPCMIQNGKITRFYPKPLLPEPDSTQISKLAKEKSGTSNPQNLRYKQGIVEITEKLKEIKKITFVSEAIFNQIVEGKLNIKDIYQSLRKRGSVSKDIEKIGSCLITYEERSKIDPEGELESFVKEFDIQKNQIDRVRCSTVEGLLFFNKEIACTGLWFLVKTEDLDFLKATFRYLEDTGIGGERTTGKGHFKIQCEDALNLPNVDSSNSFIILSRYLPEGNELNLISQELSNWNIINIRPKRETMYLQAGERILKDSLRLFTEGSIFHVRERKDYYGKIEDVGNMGTYTAYHNGLAIPVFANIGGA